MLVQELENALGGIWSIMTIELLLPMIKSRYATMQRTGKLPKMPAKAIYPVVVTGIDSLGRANELNRLDSLMTRAANVLGPQAVPQFFNVIEYLKRASAAEDIEPKGLLKTQQEVDQANQAAQQQAMVQKLGGPAIAAMSKAASDGRLGQPQGLIQPGPQA